MHSIRQFVTSAAAALLAMAIISPPSWGQAPPDPPLITAAKSGDLMQVKSLLVKGADPNKIQDSDRFTALNWSAYYGNLPITQALVEHSAKVDASSNKKQWTPLMNAASMGHRDVAIYLAKHGADFDAMDVDGYTPLSWAMGKNHDEIARDILRYSTRNQGVRYGADTLVLFINNSSGAVTVSVDGRSGETIQPNTRMFFSLDAGDSDRKQSIHAKMGTRTFDDRVSISECHWNWNGMKSYTITSQSVPFECKK